MLLLLFKPHSGNLSLGAKHKSAKERQRQVLISLCFRIATLHVAQILFYPYIYTRSLGGHDGVVAETNVRQRYPPCTLLPLHPDFVIYIAYWISGRSNSVGFSVWVREEKVKQQNQITLLSVPHELPQNQPHFAPIANIMSI